MRKKTLAEINDAIARGLFRRWLLAAGADLAAWERQYTVGISRRNAQAVTELTDGEVTVTDWPHVLPELHLATQALHKRLPKSRVNGMQTAQRLAISKGSTAREAFAQTLRKAGYTQNGMAKALNVSKGLLSRHRMPRGNPLSLPIPRPRAERIEDLAGWPADAAHWPAGIS